jgi:hypothetical protein
MSFHSDAERLQNCITSMGPELGALFHRLTNECAHLHLKWHEYVLLFGTNEARVALLNRAAAGFTGLVEEIFWDDLLLHICRLTDDPKVGRRNREALSLRQLPSMELAPELRMELPRLVYEAQKASGFARDWRDRRIAHRDLHLALNPRAKPLDDASRQLVGAALDGIVAVLHAVEAHYCHGSRMGYAFTAGPAGDAEALLHVLRDGLEAADKRRQRLLDGKPLPEDVQQKPPL